MSSLLRMTEEQLAAAESVPGLRPRTMFGIAGGSAVLAFLGMAIRYSPGDAVPLDGMDAFAGQLRWSFALGLFMLAAALLVRGVIMRRLQWAVLISLLLHLIFGVILQFMGVGMPLEIEAPPGDEDIPLQQLALPDYGGMESPNVERQQWERTTDVNVSQTRQQQLERQVTELDANGEPERVERTDRAEPADTPDRREQQDQMHEAAELEMQRETQQAQADAPEQLDAPNVNTAAADSPSLESREMSRSESDPRTAQREMQEIASRQRRQAAAARLAARSEVRPEEFTRMESSTNARRAARAEAADTTAESVDVAGTRSTRRSETEARELSASRQEANLPSREQSSSPASASSRSSVSATRMNTGSSPSRAARANARLAGPAGGAASMRRSTTSGGRNTSASGATADSVNVASAGGASSPSLNAADSATGTSRGRASVPNRSRSGGGGMIASGRPSRSGVGALRAGSLGRRSGSGSGPQLGQAVGGSSGGGGTRGRSGARGSGSGSAVGAVGTGAAEVAVGSVGRGGGSSGDAIGAGPAGAATNVGRTGTGLPGGRRGGSTAPGGSGTGRSGRGMRAAGRSGLTGRSQLAGSGASGARLSGDVAGGRTAGGRGRVGTAATLPAGALQAERGGSLVIAGPQADGGSGSGRGTGGRLGSGLSGPRTGGARRRAGLPGSGRGKSSVARRRPGLPGRSGGSRAGRARTSGGGPQLANARELAGLIKRSVPGISPIPTERISAGFSLRRPETRVEAVRKLGGNDASEAAVDRGLKWLVAHQHTDGRWTIEHLNCRDHQCSGHGSYKADTAATGLALLAFLGAGHTHQSGEYRSVVARGIESLLNGQKANGDLYSGRTTKYVWFYSHGMAAIALCEAYGMTKDQRLRDPAQRALDFIAASQHEQFGGWRYRPNFESDTSVSGWQLMALKSGEMAGLEVSRSTYTRVAAWLDSVESKSSPGTFAYHPTKQVSTAMTAEGLLMRQYLGAKRTDESLLAGASYLSQRRPRNEARDVYYWYYATQVMFHLQGEHWQSWNAGLRDMLTDSQEKDGPTRGSWDPAGSGKDKWGTAGGRHYVTCLNLLMLEVYYRHLPLYIDFEQQ